MIKEKIFINAPLLIQNILISIYNVLAYNKRYGANYIKFSKDYKLYENLSLENLKQIQAKKYSEFITYAIKHSNYYKEALKNIDNPEDINNINKLPILTKSLLKENLNDIHTVSSKKGYKSSTGGTTGKSLVVLAIKSDVEERFAIIANFRKKYGYQLGKRTAWFSGKNLLNKRDLRNNRYWKTDYYYKVRYYSTFHLKKKSILYYINNLKAFKPEYCIGFPSTMYEIANYGLLNKIDFPNNIIKAIFPTAETTTPEMREKIELFFKTKIYDQYASSEGAPFIFECEKRNLHIQLQTGVFEVLNANNESTTSGRLVLTSFTTKGTPLIRYDIGDGLEISDKKCTCGNNNPLALRLLGRVYEYISLPSGERISAANFSNTLKNTDGILNFQIIQNDLNKIDIKIVIDKQTFSAVSKSIFLNNLRNRVGHAMKINLIFVEYIPVEPSGKYRMIKNNVL